jgi:guanosine-3',5'-bis(diphosphate) 3'-pyrophosphohydrolase
MESEVLEQVRAFAAAAHGEQKRKYTDELYIEHPVRVMETVRQYNKSLPVLSAALLHDVLEDTAVSSRDLQKFLCDILTQDEANETHKLVVELTDVYVKKDYPMLNRRTRKQRESERLALTSGNAHTIKYADIMDNVVDVLKNDSDFSLTYIRECKHLLPMINKGDAELYARAAKTVDECLREFWNKANVKAL